MSGRLLQQRYSYSQKYQRELALGIVFQYIYYEKFFSSLYLGGYFSEVLNRVILKYYDYNEDVWNIIYRANFFVLNYMERALLILLLAEIDLKKVPSNLLVFIYIRLAKKYCRKNFHKLIPVFVAYAEKDSHF
ncbi:MAG: hypothetical protein RMJ36_02880 [Candidatus Calescibacterium sp.]|nr:hypothetical protein [Candidatus Calescibacterium sp.]MDW8132583.1 hypothetical protein [Candidatus Calescibacterium sp.]